MYVLLNSSSRQSLHRTNQLRQPMSQPTFTEGYQIKYFEIKYEIGSITKMGMLEHVLLRYANETLNGYCYVNIILDYFILIFYFQGQTIIIRKVIGALGNLGDAIFSKYVTQSTMTLCFRVLSASESSSVTTLYQILVCHRCLNNLPTRQIDELQRFLHSERILGYFLGGI